MTTATPNRGRSGAASSMSVLQAVRSAHIVPLAIEQYQQMIEEGIVPEDNSVELLRGVLVRKDRSSPGEDPMGHSPRHWLVIVLLTELAGKIKTSARFMQIQLPFACPPDGAPEPDAAIVVGEPRDYVKRFPRPRDVSCVIEVAHSSLDRDREDKLQIYAAGGVPQYVIVNLLNDTVEVYSDPDQAEEQYRTKETRERGNILTLRLPDGTFDVAVNDLLP